MNIGISELYRRKCRLIPDKKTDILMYGMRHVIDNYRILQNLLYNFHVETTISMTGYVILKIEHESIAGKSYTYHTEKMISIYIS